MTAQPQLTSLDLWARHEQRCVRILREALARLGLPDPAESENDINRRLFRCILDVSRSIEIREQIELPVVVYEGRNPPLASDQTRSQRECKVPDFFWAYFDHDGDEPARQFVVECKRLTVATSRWNYTQQYVAAGVLRFISPAHGYGKASPAGAMVGYVQAIDEAVALVEVNGHLHAEGLPLLADSSLTHGRHVERDHLLKRSFHESPFYLRHLWLSDS